MSTAPSKLVCVLVIPSDVPDDENSLKRLDINSILIGLMGVDRMLLPDGEHFLDYTSCKLVVC